MSWFAAKPSSAAAPPDPAVLAASLFVTVGACFGTMFIGVLVARNSLLSADARRGVSLLYAKLVFPAMVFRGVAAIDLGAVDPSILGVMLLSKWALALCGLAFGALAGRGFYDWDGRDAKAEIAAAAARLRRLIAHLDEPA